MSSLCVFMSVHLPVAAAAMCAQSNLPHCAYGTHNNIGAYRCYMLLTTYHVFVCKGRKSECALQHKTNICFLREGQRVSLQGPCVSHFSVHIHEAFLHFKKERETKGV